MIQDWINNIRSELVEPIAMALVGLATFLVEYKIVRAGLHRYGDAAESSGGRGEGLSLKERALEILKDYGITMLVAAVIGGVFFFIAANLEEIWAIISDIGESIRP